MNTRFNKILAICLCALMVAAVFAGCQTPVNIDQSGAAALQDYPVEVEGVTLDSRPSKVIALSGSLADIILAMGYETSLVAISNDSTQADLSELTKIDATDTNGIINLGADVVIASEYASGQKEALTEAGIKCFEIKMARNREDFERLYTQIGSILYGASTGYSNGLSTAQRIFTSMDDLSRIIPKSDTVITGAYLFDTEGRAVTGDMLATTVMTYSGITNVLKGSEGGTYDFENLRITNPEYIFCPADVKKEIMSNENFKKLNAVQNNKVIEMDESAVLWEGRTIVTTGTTFAGIAYPELLEESTASATMVEPGTTPTPAPEASPEANASATPSPTLTPSNVNWDEIVLDESGYTTLTTGAEGDDVLLMQATLYALGYLTVEYDGMYGQVTSQSVSDFQSAHGITATGEATPRTLAMLYSSYARAKSTTGEATPTPSPTPAAESSSEASTESAVG